MRQLIYAVFVRMHVTYMNGKRPVMDLDTGHGRTASASAASEKSCIHVERLRHRVFLDCRPN